MKTLFAAALCMLCATITFAAEPYFNGMSLVLPDGKTLVAGAVRGESGYTMAVQRRLRDGAPDPSFGGNGDGIALLPFWRYYEFASVLVLQPDGRILVGGNAADSLLRSSAAAAGCHPAFCLYYPVVARLEPDGALDVTFNGSGRIALAIGNANEDVFTEVQDYATFVGLGLNADGTIYVIGDSSRVAVARLLPDGTLDRSFRGGAPARAHEIVFARHQGLWYTPGKDGWNLAISQQGESLFGVWFLQEETGSPLWGSWLAWVASKSGPSAYSGALYEVRGPSFYAPPFDPASVVTREVGSATLEGDAAGNGSFAYVLGSRTGTKRLRISGVPPTCTTGAQSNLSLATNYDGHWWAAPGGSEPGWGVHLTHQGYYIHLAWMTYDETGAPAWFSASTARQADGRFVGQLLHQLRFTGLYGELPGDTESVGVAELSFTNGNAGTFRYTVYGVAQAKSITRFVFEGPGTICSQ
jgi:uncharacterized delta-60 repeat protein